MTVPTTDIRETRTGAREVKFLVPDGTAHAIVSIARVSLTPDPHGEGPEPGGYRTTTIYFDTTDQLVRQQRGSYGRCKYRIRRYGSAEVAFLERKVRTDSLLAKRRFRVPTVVLAELRESGPAARGPAWFSERLKLRQLDPVCQITYHRRAFVGEGPWGPYRLTIDEQIEARSHHSTEFGEPDGLAVLSGRSVVEMKFCREAPSPLKRIVEDFGLAPVPLSKYRAGMAQLDQTTTGPAAVGRTHDARPMDALPILEGLANA